MKYKELRRTEDIHRGSQGLELRHFKKAFLENSRCISQLFSDGRSRAQSIPFCTLHQGIFSSEIKKKISNQFQSQHNHNFIYPGPQAVKMLVLSKT